MAKAAKITFKEFRTKFATEDDCRKYLFDNRFPNGFECPKCGGREYYYLKTRQRRISVFFWKTGAGSS
jgi:transcription initiation factor IIE alpha subunit